MIGREDVDDQVAEIEEHPAAVGRAFAVANIVAFRLERFFKVISECVELQRRLRGGDHEVVGERSRSGDVEEGDIQCLVVRQDIDCPLGEGFGIQEVCSIARCCRAL